MKNDLLKEYARQHYKAMLREPEGLLTHPFLVPGRVYHNRLRSPKRIPAAGNAAVY